MSEAIFADFTGNPFVDAGICAISEWVGKKIRRLDKNDLKETVNDIIYLYFQKKWTKKIHSIFQIIQ